MTTPVNPISPISSSAPASGQDSAKSYSAQAGSALSKSWFAHWFPGASEKDCKTFISNMMRAMNATIQQDERMAHRAYERMKRSIQGQN